MSDKTTPKPKKQKPETKPVSDQASTEPKTVQSKPKPKPAKPENKKYAVIKDGSFQYLVKEGNRIFLQRLGLAPESELEFKEVLLYGDDQKVEVGSPLLTNVSVKGKVIAEVKDRKVRTVKFRKREGYKRTIGHRQKYTAVKIESIASA